MRNSTNSTHGHVDFTEVGAAPERHSSAAPPDGPSPDDLRRHGPLRAWRLYRDLSQYDLHERSGIGRDTISRLETTDQSPQGLTAAKLALALRCTVHQLFPEGDE